MLINNHHFLNTPDRVQARHARQLSDAIALNLNVPDGSGLVPYLAPGEARNNREAIRLWVISRVDLMPTITPSIVEQSSVLLADTINSALEAHQVEYLS